jgi:hypothetical protein
MLRQIKRKSQLAERKEARKRLLPAFLRYQEQCAEAGEKPMSQNDWLKGQGW